MALLESTGGLLLGAHGPVSSPSRSLPPHMQMAPAPLKTRTKQTFKTGDGGKGGGKGGAAAQIAKPKRKTHIEEVPLWKVILLGDEDYEEDPVCEVLLQVECCPSRIAKGCKSFLRHSKF